MGSRDDMITQSGEAFGADSVDVQQLVHALEATSLLAHLLVTVGDDVLSINRADAREGFQLGGGGGIEGDAPG